jgi:UDP-3-O-[3-hydroxymyristoyl] glucosamine N-acyltransferase
MSAAYSLAQLAARFGLELSGADRTVRGVATLLDAGPEQVSFLANRHYRAQLGATRAAAVVLARADRAQFTGSALVSLNPYADFARIATLFEPPTSAAPGVHPSAVIDPAASVHASASIGPHCSVAARAHVGAGVVLGPGCIVGEDCSIGAGSRLVARVTLVTRVRLGARVLIHPGAVLGADGFGLAHDAGRWLKVPQLGGVVIGDDCEIGANTTIDRGALGDTVLDEDVRLDNQIQIGHNVHVGAHTAVAGCVAIAGSARIGRECLIAGGVGIVGHIEIADRVKITAMTLVSHSIRDAGEYSSGTGIQDSRAWRRNAVRFRQLDDMARRLAALAKDEKK